MNVSQNQIEKNQKEVSPRIELGSPDSKTDMITITL
jgi:hypothetical protein